MKYAQASLAHALLFAFTLLVALKLDHAFSHSWVVFSPLWVFHAVVSRGRFSLPAPIVPHDRHWAPCHAVVAVPLLVAFELLLCIYLESSYAYQVTVVNLHIVFLPLMVLETCILIDNCRMCKPLFLGEGEAVVLHDGEVDEEMMCEVMPHVWISASMILILIATILMVNKLNGDGTLNWWNLLTAISFAQVCAFFVSTKWSNPLIHRHGQTMESSSSSETTGLLDLTNSLIVQPEEYQNQDSLMCCSLQHIGGHVMKVLIVLFEVLLCMHLEGTPAIAKDMPISVVASPLLLLQGVGVLFSTIQLVERMYLLFRNKARVGGYFAFSIKVGDFLEFLLRGSRFLAWWSIDEGSKEQLARILHEDGSGYDTFSSYPPHVVKKMPKKELTEEVWRLQATLGELTEFTKFSRQEYERIQNERILCRICFAKEINIVVLPCRHRVLCRWCCERCQDCPICRIPIKKRLQVYDA